jgi:hypothetical protein
VYKNFFTESLNYVFKSLAGTLFDKQAAHPAAPEKSEAFFIRTFDDSRIVKAVDAAARPCRRI